LNGARGEKEAPSPTKYMTIYDGTGTDRFYLPWLFSLPVRDQDSPALQGAENHTLPGLTHDELRLDPHATSLYLKFVQGHSARPGSISPIQAVHGDLKERAVR
jgi:hypothetical protein